MPSKFSIFPYIKWIVGGVFLQASTHANTGL